MTAPRVQAIDRLADNEPGRCSDWIARQPEYANFYDERCTLPPCQPLAPSVNDNGSVNSCMEGCYNGLDKNPFNQALCPNLELAYDVPLPCVESSVSIERSPSQCGQFRDCAQNGTANGAKNCQLVGPIDVEDLALYFEPERSQINCPPRSYRQFRRANSTRYDPYDKQLTCFPPNETDLPCAGWNEAQLCNSCPQLFDFCTEERWLQCPASYRCPVYDISYSYGQNVPPPCLYEDLRNERCPYGYNEDEQLLDDYL